MNINKIQQVSEIYNTTSVRKVMPKNVRERKQDELELSDKAKSFQIAYKAIKDAPDVRQDKIDDIKQRMNSGSYNVSAEQVAEKLMSKGFDKTI